MMMESSEQQYIKAAWSVVHTARFRALASVSRIEGAAKSAGVGSEAAPHIYSQTR